MLLAPTSAPTNMRAIVTSATSITVMWEEVLPIDQNGVITMYGVLLTSDHKETLPIENITGLSVNVSGLTSNVIYHVSVRAHTVVGGGPYSSPVTIQFSK